MDKKSKIVIIIGVLVPTIVFIAIIIIVWWYRRNRNYSGKGYNQVNHELDGEEIEFKRMLESRADEEEEFDEEMFSGEDSAEFSFDSKDKDRLNMLEKFRTNLVSSASAAANQSESEDDSGTEKEQLRL